MTATEHFDSYLEWLGIQPHEHPVDHYRLLGLERFESDQSVISSAADQRMSHVRNFQTGPRGRHTQDLLNALSVAKLCLVNTEAKARYDSQLVSREPLAPPRVENAPLPPPVSTIAAGSPAEPEAPPVADSVAPPAPDSQAESRSSKKLLVPAAAAGGVIVVAVLVWFIGHSLSSSENATDGDNSAAEQKSKSSGDGPPKDNTPPEAIVIQQEGSGAINFPASLAKIKQGAKYQNRGGDGLITGIASKEELLSWKFQVARRGAFKVLIEYAAAEASTDGGFEIAIGDQKARFSVRESGGGFVTDEKKIFITKSGRHTLTLRPTKISGGELMTLRSIRLEPAS